MKMRQKNILFLNLVVQYAKVQQRSAIAMLTFTVDRQIGVCTIMITSGKKNRQQ